MSPANTVPESRVLEIWQNRLQSRTDLVTEEGEPVSVVYPGRPNDNRGPDLLDAVLESELGTFRGDIEIHVRSSQWRAHGHHQDPNYNRVILHVSFWNDTDANCVILQNGHRVPTLALNRFTAESSLHGYPLAPPSMPCLRRPGNVQCSLGRILDAAGEERFLSRAAEFSGALTGKGAGQVLYEGIMRALGYARNREPMTELARKMPLGRLEIGGPGGPDDRYLARTQALLLGTAGLLPSQRAKACQGGGAWVAELERAWVECSCRDTMRESDWRLFKVRPGNLPARRIAAMSCLLLRFKEKGLAEGLLDRLAETPVNKSPRDLEKALFVPPVGYWAGHLEPGAPLHTGMPALLGAERAADIIVNVLLSFAAAWCRHNECPELAEKAIDIYRRYPRLQANSIERHMTNQLGISRRLVDTARRQQGLLHVYRTFCSQGDCNACPVAGY